MSNYESILPTTAGSEALTSAQNIAKQNKGSEALMNINKFVEQITDS